MWLLMADKIHEYNPGYICTICYQYHISADRGQYRWMPYNGSGHVVIPIGHLSLSNSGGFTQSPQDKMAEILWPKFSQLFLKICFGILLQI